LNRSNEKKMKISTKKLVVAVNLFHLKQPNETIETIKYNGGNIFIINPKTFSTSTGYTYTDGGYMVDISKNSVEKLYPNPIL
jgi:hypothetical protein